MSDHTMITALSIERADGQYESLLTPGSRHVATVEGLVGLSVRELVRARPGRHGNLNTSRYRDSDPIVIVGELFGEDADDAWSEYNALAAALASAVDTDRSLRWSGGTVLDLVETQVRLVSMSQPVTVAEDVLRYQLTLRPGDPRSFAQSESVAGEGRTALRTNLATNPAAREGLTTDWAGSGLASPLAATGSLPTLTGLPDGVTTGLHVVGNSSGDRIVIDFPVESGVEYTVSAYVYLDTHTTAGVQLRVDDSVGASQGGSTADTTDDVWTRISLTFTADETATWKLRIQQNTTGATDFYTTAVLIEEGASAGAYFDGDTENGEWSGTPSDSTSVLYDPGDTLGASGGGMEFPVTFPITFNPAGGGSVEFTVAGTDTTPPVFEIHGFCTSPVLTLQSTGEEIRLSGEVDAGRYVEVDVAAREVRLDDGTVRNNLYDYENSTWFELPPGPQTVQLTASSFDADAFVRVRYRAAYA